MEVTALPTSSMSVAGYEEVGEEVEVGDGEGCKVNIAPFAGWGRKGSTWVIDVGILRDFA